MMWVHGRDMRHRPVSCPLSAALTSEFTMSSQELVGAHGALPTWTGAESPDACTYERTVTSDDAVASYIYRSTQSCFETEGCFINERGICMNASTSLVEPQAAKIGADSSMSRRLGNHYYYYSDSYCDTEECTRQGIVIIVGLLAAVVGFFFLRTCFYGLHTIALQRRCIKEMKNRSR